MKIGEIIDVLEQFAPLSLQESYDNCGLITGDKNTEAKSAILTLDCTEEVVDEAIEANANLIIAHHPIVFSGLKKINGKTYVERVIIKAIKNDIAIYAMHTNLDNVINGVNRKIAEKLHLNKLSILSSKTNLLKKLQVFVPKNSAENLRDAIFESGAGFIGNYSECSFNTEGFGTFKANEIAQPFVGEKEIRHTETEIKIECIFPNYLENKIISALKKNHPYEEPAFDIISLNNYFNDVGSGIIGELETEMDSQEFLNFLKKNMNLSVVRYTNFNKKIKKVAICGGSGSFLLKDAKASQADAFVTADFKYHEFFDAENQLMICDIGHFESEQFTVEIFEEILKKKFSTFALLLSKINTNPINYYI